MREQQPGQQPRQNSQDASLAQASCDRRNVAERLFILHGLQDAAVDRDARSFVSRESLASASISARLVIARRKAPKTTLTSDDHLNSTLDVTWKEIARARQRLPPSFSTDGTREISRCNTPLSSKPINLRLCCDDLGPHVALSFSLRARRAALDPSHFRALLVVVVISSAEYARENGTR